MIHSLEGKMKKLLIAMMAVLAFNVTYAAQLGEEMGIPDGECSITRGDAQRAAKERIDDRRDSQEKSEEGSSVIAG